MLSSSSGFLALLSNIILWTSLFFGNVWPEDSNGFGYSRREEVIDQDNKYALVWGKDFETQVITFEVIVETLGFVGFGISPNGGMTGADVIIGGVHANGTSYFTDRHAIGNQEPIVDSKQDWKLLKASENATHTTLRFSRLFDTCDENDIKISNDTKYLIWSFGDSDTITYHGKRGSYSAILLDPPMPPFQSEGVKTWRMSSIFDMPAAHTTYWCRIFKSPSETVKHHIIGFEAFLPTPDSIQNTHHMIVRKCGAEGVDLRPIMEPMVNGAGYDCYSNSGNAHKANSYCKQYLFAWGVGGKRIVYPDHVGLPLSDTGKPEYFVMEIHYNNVKGQKGLKIQNGMDVFYTSNLRKNEAGLLIVGHDVTISQLVPPKSEHFINVGHCSSECTKDAMPKGGITVFNILLHTHLAGRAIKLRHYRDGKELPWVSNDGHYHADFQQNRPLTEEIKVFPGDQLSLECTYETLERPNVTIGGFGSTEEMCQTFLMYYPQLPLQMCGSFYPSEELLETFGIDSVSKESGETDAIILTPPALYEKRCSEILNKVDWNPKRVNELQNRLQFGSHKAICFNYPRRQGHPSLLKTPVAYIKVPEEYAPPDSCPK